MQTTETGISAEMQRCIDECLRCYSTCEQTIQHCLEMGGKHAQPSHIRLLADCVEICRTSAGFMLRGSPFHTTTCSACAKICRACEQDCRKMADDAAMQRCADECRRCAESCERMSHAA